MLSRLDSPSLDRAPAAKAGHVFTTLTPGRPGNIEEFAPYHAQVLLPDAGWREEKKESRMKSIISGLKNQGIRVAAAAALLATLGTGLAHAALSYAGDSALSVLAAGPAGLKITTELKEKAAFRVAEADGVVTVSVPWLSLTTGMDLRDGHMRKYFHADQHPTVTVALKRGDLKFPEDKQEARANAKASVTINGVTKELPVEYLVKRTGSDLHVKGKFKMKITDFKVELPTYLGQGVNDEVEVKAGFKLRDS